MKTALVIMAAGIGSRFGGGIKQLAAVGPNGEIIMDYSIHDAIEAGFDKIVFIIRHDIEDAFKEAIGDRIEKICAELGVEIDYAFQALENVPAGYSVPEGRSKPWGTGQAVLACKGIIKEPFAVINADDYYGKEAFVRLHDFLQGYTPDKAGHGQITGLVGRVEHPERQRRRDPRHLPDERGPLPDRRAGDQRHRKDLRWRSRRRQEHRH